MAIELIGKIKPKNGGKFAMVDAEDVELPDGTRLSEKDLSAPRDGLTPLIGANGNWWIGETDTGVQAQGEDGAQGQQGEQGIQGEAGAQGATGFGIYYLNWETQSGSEIGGQLNLIDTGGRELQVGDLLISTDGLLYRVTSLPGEGYILDWEAEYLATLAVHGNTPYIGKNNNWWIGEEDTGVKAGVTDTPGEVILEETELTGFETAEGAEGVYHVGTDGTLNLVVGNTYLVVWNGVEHTCVCATGASANGTTITSPYLGNPGVFLKLTGATEYPDTGETFLIIEDDTFSVLTSEEGDSHKVAIYLVEAKEKELPEVTTEDNGKFLRVVDGAWAAVAVDSAEGASF